MNFSDRLFSYDNLFSQGQLKLPIAEIYQVSELSVVRGGEVSSHYQRCDEITYAISGSAYFYENENWSMVSAGQIHFIKEGNTHRIKVLPDENFRYICIGFVPDKEDPVIKDFNEKTANLPYFTINDNGTIKHLSEYLIREFYNSDKYSYEAINQYMSLILTTIMRILGNKAFDFHEEHHRSANYSIYKVLRYIDREYMQIESVKAVSEELSFNEYYLSHLFKEKMGITIKEYLNKKKISHAMEMLLTSELSIEQIALSLNFSCAHSFRRAFKEETGVSPAEYRKGNQK